MKVLTIQFKVVKIVHEERIPILLMTNEQQTGQLLKHKIQYLTLGP